MEDNAITRQTTKRVKKNESTDNVEESSEPPKQKETIKQATSAQLRKNQRLRQLRALRRLRDRQNRPTAQETLQEVTESEQNKLSFSQKAQILHFQRIAANAENSLRGAKLAQSDLKMESEVVLWSQLSLDQSKIYSISPKRLKIIDTKTRQILLEKPLNYEFLSTQHLEGCQFLITEGPDPKIWLYYLIDSRKRGGKKIRFFGEEELQTGPLFKHHIFDESSYHKKFVFWRMDTQDPQNSQNPEKPFWFAFNVALDVFNSLSRFASLITQPKILNNNQFYFERNNELLSLDLVKKTFKRQLSTTVSAGFGLKKELENLDFVEVHGTSFQLRLYKNNLQNRYYLRVYDLRTRKLVKNVIIEKNFDNPNFNKIEVFGEGRVVLDISPVHFAGPGKLKKVQLLVLDFPSFKLLKNVMRHSEHALGVFSIDLLDSEVGGALGLSKMAQKILSDNEVLRTVQTSKSGKSNKENLNGKRKAQKTKFEVVKMNKIDLFKGPEFVSKDLILASPRHIDKQLRYLVTFRDDNSGDYELRSRIRPIFYTKFLVDSEAIQDNSFAKKVKNGRIETSGEQNRDKLGEIVERNPKNLEFFYTQSEPFKLSIPHRKAFIHIKDTPERPEYTLIEDQKNGSYRFFKFAISKIPAQNPPQSFPTPFDEEEDTQETPQTPPETLKNTKKGKTNPYTEKTLKSQDFTHRRYFTQPSQKYLVFVNNYTRMLSFVEMGTLKVKKIQIPVGLQEVNKLLYSSSLVFTDALVMVLRAKNVVLRVDLVLIKNSKEWSEGCVRRAVVSVGEPIQPLYEASVINKRSVSFFAGEKVDHFFSLVRAEEELVGVRIGFTGEECVSEEVMRAKIQDPERAIYLKSEKAENSENEQILLFSKSTPFVQAYSLQDDTLSTLLSENLDEICLENEENPIIGSRYKSHLFMSQTTESCYGLLHSDENEVLVYELSLKTLKFAKIFESKFSDSLDLSLSISSTRRTIRTRLIDLLHNFKVIDRKVHILFPQYGGLYNLQNGQLYFVEGLRHHLEHLKSIGRQPPAKILEFLNLGKFEDSANKGVSEGKGRARRGGFGYQKAVERVVADFVGIGGLEVNYLNKC